MTGNPQVDWTDATKALRVGDLIDVPIIAIAPPGIFVDVGGGLQGLVHRATVLDATLSTIAKSYSVGDSMRVVVVDIDDDAKRIALSAKPEDFEIGRRWTDLDLASILGHDYDGTVFLDERETTIVMGPLPFFCRLDHEYRPYGHNDTLKTGAPIQFRVIGTDERHKHFRGVDLESPSRA